jgi:multisubunit Na+/H+ antiporter MnhG subunit
LERGEGRKVIEPRIYRAAFLPALLALVLVAFSLESAPRAAPQGLAADALFEGVGTVSMVRDIATTTPDRRAGHPGDAAVASRVKQAFVSHGFTTTIDRFDQDGTKLVNVIGRRPGNTSKQIVVMAARDAATVPDESGSAADTAALIEFARVFEGRASKRTLVLASVDGSQLGDAGARRFAETLGNPGDVEAVVVLSNLGATRSSGPLVVGWSNSVGRGNLGIERTVASSLREELASIPHQEGAFAQFARLTFPIAPGAQGVLLPAGIDAVRLSGSGELRPAGTGKQVEVLRYGSLGRAALRVVSALDAERGTPQHGPAAYIQFAGKVMPAWPVRLLALAFLLPALIASIDALARTRRRREPVSPWLVWLASALLPFVLGIALALLLVLVGLARDAPPAPLDPRSLTLDTQAICSLVATVLAILLAWILGRSSVIRRAASLPDPTAPGAACIASLALCLLVLVLVFTNPFAALLLVPAAHLWMLGTMTDATWRTGVVMYLIGLLPVALVAAYYMVRLGLGPLDGAWYLFLLVTGNETGVFTTAALVLLAAITGSVGAILLARARHGEPARERRAGGRPAEPAPSIFGPGGHAGPGAIGNARSTLGR